MISPNEMLGFMMSLSNECYYKLGVDNIPNIPTSNTKKRSKQIAKDKRNKRRK